MTQRTSIVLDVEVVFDGQVHRASYFVECGMVHAMIGPGLVLALLGSGGDAAGMVKTRLLDHLRQQSKKTELVYVWQRRMGDDHPAHSGNAP